MAETTIVRVSPDVDSTSLAIGQVSTTVVFIGAPGGDSGLQVVQGPQGPEGPQGAPGTITTLHADFTDTDTDGHPISVIDGLQDELDAINAILAAYNMSDLVDDIVWTEVDGGVGFQNSWVNHTPATVATAGFRKVGKIVHLKGLVKSGNSGTVIFTLPVGYRPTKYIDCTTIGTSSGGTSFLQLVQIAPTGTVTTLGSAGNAMGYQTLDCLYFTTDQ